MESLVSYYLQRGLGILWLRLRMGYLTWSRPCFMLLNFGSGKHAFTTIIMTFCSWCHSFVIDPRLKAQIALQLWWYDIQVALHHVAWCLVEGCLPTLQLHVYFHSECGRIDMSVDWTASLTRIVNLNFFPQHDWFCARSADCVARAVVNIASSSVTLLQCWESKGRNNYNINLPSI